MTLYAKCVMCNVETVLPVGMVDSVSCSDCEKIFTKEQLMEAGFKKLSGVTGQSGFCKIKKCGQCLTGGCRCKCHVEGKA